MRPVDVVNQGDRHRGVRLEAVVAYDYDIDPKWFPADRRPSGPVRQRSFVLLDEQIQPTQAAVLPVDQAGWWYVDLVEIRDRGDVIEVEDDFLDVLVGTPGHSYRVFDLDEYADAAESGRVSPERLLAGLRVFQAFLDRHLNRRNDSSQEWPDFPPAAIEPLRSVAIPPMPA